MSVRKKQPRPGRIVRQSTFAIIVIVLLVLFWVQISLVEWRTGQRTFPWNAYALCGNSTPTTLPDTVHVGLYEEFPVPWRLDKLGQIDFPVTLAITAPSDAEFLELREEILQTYQVREVYFWPVLSQAEGYYPGAWSDPHGVRQAAAQAEEMRNIYRR